MVVWTPNLAKHGIYPYFSFNLSHAPKRNKTTGKYTTIIKSCNSYSIET